MSKLRILLLGSGGRESALAWKISKSPRNEALYIAPGNGGTSAYGTNVDLSPLDFDAIRRFVSEKSIDMIVVGNEDPLVAGIYDYFEADPVLVVGPSKQGAALEGSKDFAKRFMSRHNIPTARYHSFTAETIDEAYAFLESLKAPYVLKADGLAAGKGVLIIDNLDEAKKALAEMFGGMFGKSSATVVIEEFLSGIECSVFVLTDGQGSYRILPVAKDYKRIGEGDTGLNTGGMGAVSPVPFADGKFMDEVVSTIVKPTVDGLAKDGIEYKGFIFIGLMNVVGKPYVIEYNVRMGDPETEVVLPRIESDIIGLFEGMAFGRLDAYELAVSPLTATTVVCVSGGYPGEYVKGREISGLDKPSESIVFHAGTTAKGGKVLTAGGRVLAVTSLGGSIEEAVGKSFATIAGIEYEDKYFRTDIGKDLL